YVVAAPPMRLYKDTGETYLDKPVVLTKDLPKLIPSEMTATPMSIPDAIRKNKPNAVFRSVDSGVFGVNEINIYLFMYLTSDKQHWDIAKTKSMIMAV
ncbi:hypothetical protein CPB97_008652, partial [Podila verticillata]